MLTVHLVAAIRDGAFPYPVHVQSITRSLPLVLAMNTILAASYVFINFFTLVIFDLGNTKRALELTTYLLLRP